MHQVLFSVCSDVGADDMSNDRHPMISMIDLGKENHPNDSTTESKTASGLIGWRSISLVILKVASNIVFSSRGRAFQPTTFDESDEETWLDQNRHWQWKSHLENTSKSNTWDLWHLRHWLHFWQLRTTISTFIETLEKRQHIFKRKTQNNWRNLVPRVSRFLWLRI